MPQVDRGPAPIPIEQDPDVRIERDDRGVVRQVLHFARPFPREDGRGRGEERDDSDPILAAEALARTYLRAHAKLFNVRPHDDPQFPGQVPLNLNSPSSVVTRDRESIAVIFSQVQRVGVEKEPAGSFELPVWAAGIRVMVALWPHRVTSAYSTVRYDVPKPVDVRSGDLRFPRSLEGAAARLGVDRNAVEAYVVYAGPEATRRPREIQGNRHAQPESEDPEATPQAPVLVYSSMGVPASPSADRDRRDAPSHDRTVPYRIYHDVELNEVIRTQVSVTSATTPGLVFPIDPRSQSADPEPGPYRPSTELDAYREHRWLRDLSAPNAGGNQDLRGPRVFVAPDNPLGIDPPTPPAGQNFDYTSRTDDFAAVSAYHHCDGAVRMLEAIGWPAAQFFESNQQAGKLPIRIVHRSPIVPGPATLDGRTVNAQVLPGGPQVVGEMRFALGDRSDAVTNPIGIATDARFVWHEFGHALLIAATGEPEFRFAHSPGDALAAIIGDLESEIAATKRLAAWRGVTFPWVEALRRHDRKVEEGWGWHGSLYVRAPYSIRDPGGYRAEQILSSTLFQLYLALGGDAWDGDDPDRPARRSAAAYTVYLLVHAIRALGPTALTPARDARALAGAMMGADVATAVLLPNRTLFRPFRAGGRRGGAVHKVVRWAFERQGLYKSQGPPHVLDAPGQPEPVDVYIDDGRNGGYQYAADWSAKPPDVRIAAAPDPMAVDVRPRVNALGHVFIRVRNRGTDPNPQPATTRVFATQIPTPIGPRWRWTPQGGPGYPWRELPGATAKVVEPGGAVDFGPFAWTPSIPGSYSLLACVDAPGDRCNALTPTFACAIGPTRLSHLVPFDNNIAHRRVDVLP